ncbi:MAG: hypothetical protein KIT45_04020 [Fimbriimonadia bacterium]|nr:hypothetical protein [Fimbriimonadia bacterium]
MPKQKEDKIAITLYLSPEQIREAYFQLLQAEHADWFEEPQVAEELLARDRDALKEYKEGETLSWTKIKGELKKKPLK